jgi:hypothetical protein
MPLKRGYGFSERDSVLDDNTSPIVAGRAKGSDVFSDKSAAGSLLVEWLLLSSTFLISPTKLSLISSDAFLNSLIALQESWPTLEASGVQKQTKQSPGRSNHQDLKA